MMAMAGESSDDDHEQTDILGQPIFATVLCVRRSRPAGEQAGQEAR